MTVSSAKGPKSALCVSTLTNSPEFIIERVAIFSRAICPFNDSDFAFFMILGANIGEDKDLELFLRDSLRNGRSTRSNSRDNAGSSSPELFEPAATFDELTFSSEGHNLDIQSNNQLFSVLNGSKSLQQGSSIGQSLSKSRVNPSSQDTKADDLREAKKDNPGQASTIFMALSASGEQKTYKSTRKFRLGSKQPVPSQPVPQKSSLTELLAQMTSSSVNNPQSVGFQDRERGVDWTIYLPGSTTPITVRVKGSETVESGIKRIVQVAGLPQSGAKYELRLHEGDGEADTDFPPLEKNRLVKQYGRGFCEYCLIKVGDATGSNEEQEEHQEESSSSGVDGGSPKVDLHQQGQRGQQQEGQGPGSSSMSETQLSMVISIANTSPITKVHLSDLDENCVVADLLPIVAMNHRLRLHTDDYVFTVSNDDKYKLKWSFRTVADMQISVRFLNSKNVRELQLKKKGFADSVGGASARTRPPANAQGISTKPSAMSASTKVTATVDGRAAQAVAEASLALGKATKGTLQQRQQQEMHAHLCKLQKIYKERTSDGHDGDQPPPAVRLARARSSERERYGDQATPVSGNNTYIYNTNSSGDNTEFSGGRSIRPSHKRTPPPKPTSATTSSTSKSRSNTTTNIRDEAELRYGAFQEWKVVRKNKFGRKQERMFGVDAFRVYNAKRAGGADLATISSITQLSNNTRSFKVFWSDSTPTEYVCTSPKDCADIVQKVSYLLTLLTDFPQ